MLKMLVIAQYEETFENNEIEAIEDLVILTREDMMELGLPIAARNRILAF